MVTSRISIDGGAAVSVNLTDPNASPTPIGGSESAMYSVVWSATNLANKSHKILVTYENYIVVDGFLCVFIHILSRKEGGRLVHIVQVYNGRWNCGPKFILFSKFRLSLIDLVLTVPVAFRQSSGVF
jgi:hypothetical protein